jgi:hypothetical protein
MSSFLDFAIAGGTAKITTLAASKKNLTIPTTDFYRPIRASIASIGRDGLDAEAVFSGLMMQVAHPASSIYPKIIEGYRAFAAARGPLRWAEPVTAALDAGPVGIAVNPEVGYVLDTAEGPLRHYLKLYLRNEPLGQRRVDFTVAAMAVGLPVREDVRLGVLDLRAKEPRVRYLSDESAKPARWRNLSALVHVEVAAYAAAWGRV